MSEINNNLGHWCDYCQCYHSSASCFNPARKMIAEVETERDVLHKQLDELKSLGVGTYFKNENDTLRKQLDIAVEAMEKIDNWTKAYPLDVFQKPDRKKARKLLEDGGMTLDAITADAMRHVITQVGKYATDALVEIERLTKK